MCGDTCSLSLSEAPLSRVLACGSGDDSGPSAASGLALSAFVPRANAKHCETISKVEQSKRLVRSRLSSIGASQEIGRSRSYKGGGRWFETTSAHQNPGDSWLDLRGRSPAVNPAVGTHPSKACDPAIGSTGDQRFPWPGDSPIREGHDTMATTPIPIGLAADSGESRSEGSDGGQNV
jgi:hypothetical protein